MKRSDIIVALIIGEVSAWLALAIFKNLRVEIVVWLLPVFLPILAMVGLWIAYIFGKKFPIIWQAAKFILVGILNTFLDLGVLNILISVSGITSGLNYSVFKGVSFLAAVINSYFWNKFWTFRKSATSESGKEFLQFFIVSAIGFGINVGVASLVVNIIGTQFAISEEIWANVGAVVATLIAMAWNFIGYKFIVFKR